MTQSDVFQVHISLLGKAGTKIKAESHEDAVLRVVSDIAKRGGESPHMMAKRLDKFATVKGPTGPAMQIALSEVIPVTDEPSYPARGDDGDLASDIADALREGP